MPPFRRERGETTRSRFFWARRPLRAAGWIALASLLGACAQRSTGAPGAVAVSREKVPAGPPLVTLSPNQRLGLVVWIHPDGSTLLFERDPHVPPPPAGLIVCRDPNDFTPHAVLEIFEAPEGRLQPARIRTGRAATGDEVVTPGPDLRAWGEAKLGQP